MSKNKIILLGVLGAIIFGVSFAGLTGTFKSSSRASEAECISLYETNKDLFYELCV